MRISHLQEAYNQLTTAMKISLLTRAISNFQIQEDSRIMATVLLRRVFSSDFQDFYPNVRSSEACYSVLY